MAFVKTPGLESLQLLFILLKQDWCRPLYPRFLFSCNQSTVSQSLLEKSCEALISWWLQVCFTMKCYSRLTTRWFFFLDEWLNMFYFSKAFVLPYQFCPLPLKMHIKAYSFVLMMVAKECLIIIQSFHSYVLFCTNVSYFQDLSGGITIPCIRNIFDSIIVGSRTRQAWFKFFLHHFPPLYLHQVTESFWAPVSSSMTWR